MEYLRESQLYTLSMALYAIYMDSAVHHILAALGGWCNRQIDGSRVLAVLCREGLGPFSEAAPGPGACCIACCGGW